MALQEDLKTAIEKNLPAEMSGVLQKRLKKGDEAIARVEQVQAELITEKRKRYTAEEEVEGLVRQVKAESAIKAASDDLKIEKAEFELEKRLIEAKVSAADVRRQDAQGFIASLLGNRVIRETTQRDMVVKNEHTCQSDFRGGDTVTVPVPGGERVESRDVTTERTEL